MQRSCSKETNEEDEITGCALMAFCYICMSIQSCFKYDRDETVDYASEGRKPAEEYFSARSNELNCSSWAYRIFGSFLNAASLFLIFSPFISQISSQVPLVKLMLASTTFAPYTAYAFAVTASLSLSTLVVGIVWLIFRPAVALCLFSICGLGTYLLFFVSGAQ